MEIPALYAAFKSGSVRTGEMEYSNNKMAIGTTTEWKGRVTAEDEDRTALVVVDIKGLNTGNMDDRLLTNMQFPGGDVWYFTAIRDVEDLFDSFMGNIVKVLMPYHSVRDMTVLEEAFEVSDCCAPVIFSGVTDFGPALKVLRGIGFTEIILYDMDGIVDEWEWKSVMDEGIIPFVRNSRTAGILREMGFERIIIDL